MFSLVELVVLKALNLESFDFAAKVAAAGGARELVTPPPARDEEQKLRESARVLAEKEKMRARHPLLANL